MDGPSLYYTYWQYQQPSTDYGDQECGTIIVSNALFDFYAKWYIGGWNNADYGSLSDGICQRRANVMW